MNHRVVQKGQQTTTEWLLQLSGIYILGQDVLYLCIYSVWSVIIVADGGLQGYIQGDELLDCLIIKDVLNNR